MNFETAQKEAEQQAKQFIGGEVLKVISADFGGNGVEDTICSTLNNLLKDHSPVKEVVIVFDEDEGEESIHLRMYHIGKLRFVEELSEEYGPPIQGNVFYIHE